ncbi:hypothetical protein F4803DRAFT_532629 [Xylaria telfairii]|nr:hypothetical protein F4803DRAFT_532629 [Xylaria telfairii]
MDSSNNGGSQNGNRASSQSGNSRKRHCSPTDTGDNHSERSLTRRQGSNQGDMAQLSMIGQVQNMRATVTVGAARNMRQFAAQVPVSVNTNEQMIYRARNAPHGTQWIAGEFRPSMIGTFRRGQRTPRNSFMTILDRSEYPLPQANAQVLPWGEPPISREQTRNSVPPTGQVAPCAICGTSNHETKRCIMLNGPYLLNERRQGFKRWCPKHLNASHTMDECRQRWNWLRDLKEVTELLVLGCAGGPAFATNLLDWRFLVNELKEDTSYDFRVLPWTPEFACQMAQKHPNMHQLVLGINIDPATISAEAAIELGAQWQTENGNEPQFSTFAELQEHAEQEYQKFQQQAQRDRELKAKKKAEDEQAIKAYRQICRQKRSLKNQKQSLDNQIESLENQKRSLDKQLRPLTAQIQDIGNQEKAFLQQYASNPEVLERCNQIEKMPGGDVNEEDTKNY